MLEIPPLPASTILLVEVGSTTDGTGIPGGEENDEMGVMIESPHEVLGLGERGVHNRDATHPTRGIPIRARRHRPDPALPTPLPAARRQGGAPRYSCRSGRRSCTPQTRDRSSRPRGRLHRAPRCPRNSGYMQSQAMRLLATPGRRTWPPRRRQPEELIAAHGYDTTYAMHCARLGFQCLELLDHRRAPAPDPRRAGRLAASGPTRRFHLRGVVEPLPRPRRPARTAGGR